jgi:hypothetical protein
MTSPVDTSVKIFHSEMAGAPVLNGQDGQLDALIEAVGVTGWGSRTLTSLVVAGGIATATFAGGAMPADRDSVMLISGVTGPLVALNGEQKLLSADSAAFTFATAASNGVAAGTIAAKIAPLGMVKAFAGTNKGAYKFNDPAATGHYLRIDDGTAAVAHAFVRGYESMSDVDTGTGPFPTSVQMANGAYWHRSSTRNSTPVKWFVIGDSRVIYFCNQPNISGSQFRNYKIHAFGDFISSRVADTFNSVMAGGSSSAYSDAYGDLAAGSIFYTQNSVYVPRNHIGIGSSTQVHQMIPGVFTGLYSGGQDQKMVFPNPTNNGLQLGKVQLVGGVNGAGAVIDRGELPGLYHCLQSLLGTFGTGTRLPGAGPLSGRTLVAVKIGDVSTNNDATNGGAVFFDLTGPWR